MSEGTQFRELVRSLGWSYGVFWSLAPFARELQWADGWYQSRGSAKLNGERLFKSTYMSASFAPGLGYVGEVFSQGQHIWVTGDAVEAQSATQRQTQFFKLAGIRTLLCFPWFDGVVELGTENLVSPNEQLLQGMRRILSKSRPSKVVRNSSDEAGALTGQSLKSFGGVDASFWNPISLPTLEEAESMLPAEKFSSLLCTDLAAVEGDSQRTTCADNNETVGADWRAEFQLTSSPTSTLQQVFTPERDEMGGARFQQYQWHIETSSESRDLGDHEQIHRSLSVRKSSGPAFKPWKKNGPVRAHKSKGNQFLLQRSFQMLRKIELLSEKAHEKRNQEQVARSISQATDAREVHSCHDEAAVNHMLAERKRREKQKENFNALRALIPFVSKTDRASILSDAIKYVKQLTSRIQELESMNRDLEAQIPSTGQ